MEVMDVPDDEPQQDLQTQTQAPAQKRGRDATVKGAATPSEKTKPVATDKSGQWEKNKEKPADKATTLSTSRSSSVTPKTMRLVSGILFSGDEGAQTSGANKQQKRRQERAESLKYFGKELPRAYDVVNPPHPPLSTSTSSSRWGLGKGKGKGKERDMGDVKEDVLRGCKRVVVIGVHGWFPGAVMRSVIGEMSSF